MYGHNSRPNICARSEPFILDSIFQHASEDPLEPKELLRDAADGIKLAMQRDLVDVCEVAGFVDTLLSTPSPFSEEKLGGGPWQVVYSRGRLLWKGWSAPGKVVNMKNAASQDFRPEDRTAVNKAEIFGSNVFVTVSGKYCPRSERPRREGIKPPAERAAPDEDNEEQVESTPVKIDVRIDGGMLHCFGKTLGLPFIKGQASFDVMYLHDDLRVLRSGNSADSGLVVQIRQEVLSKICGRHLE